MIIGTTQGVTDPEIKMRIRVKDSKEYPFSLRINHNFTLLLTEDEMTKLYTEVTETLHAYDFYSETVND